MDGFELSQLVFFCTIIVCSQASLYDPHLFPEHGPFFEGWYMRFTDTQNARTFGVLFGKVLPKDSKSASRLIFTGLIYDDANTSHLLSYNAFPTQAVLNLTERGGRPISWDPDVKSPANFRWDLRQAGYVEVTPTAAYIDITVDRVRFEAQIGASFPWDLAEEGPQSWLLRLPLTPLFWFVYSIHSPVISYSWRHLDSGKVISGTSGSVHMEKNWGKSFPDSWVWTQGIRADLVSFAIAFGPVSFGPITMSGHLGGYRNPAKSIDINFRPDDSYMTHTLDPCAGSIRVVINTLSYKLVFAVSAHKSTFTCLYGPMFNGFQKVCIESFKATAEVEVFKRRWFWMQLVDSQTIKISALEFGGAYMCGGTCS